MWFYYILFKLVNTEQKLWRKVEKYSVFLNMIPFVSAIFVCNSLSFSKVDNNSDIDLFIVSKKNRLFLCRFFTTFFLQILGVRRHGNKINGRFCLSFYVDEDSVNLEKIMKYNDFYLAFWIKNLKVIISRNLNTDFVIKKNFWIKSFFVKNTSFNIDEEYLFHKNSNLKKVLEMLFNFNIFEKSCRFFQISRAKKKLMVLKNPNKSIVINNKMLKFHNNDQRDFYNSAFVEKFGLLSKIDDSNFLSLFD